MLRERARVLGARATVVVCAAVGMAVMSAATSARSQTVGSNPASAVATSAPTPHAQTGSVGEQPTVRAASAPEAPSWVDAEGRGRAFVYPPQTSAPTAKPVTVLLHGMCGHPQNACRPFVDVSTSHGWLVCPQGEDVCGGGNSWRLNGPDDAKLVDASVAAVAQAHAGELDASSPRVLVGFSLGGIAAMQIAQASRGTYAGLVVVAAQVYPDAAKLKQAGIQRVVLAAGDYDMTRADLQRNARALTLQGIPTRFVSLGKFGHGYPADMEDRMREPMTWVAGGA